MTILNTGEEFPIGTFNVYSRSLTDGSEVFDVYMVGTYESDGDPHAPSARQQLIVEAVSEGRAYHAASLFEQAYKVAKGQS